MWPFSLATSAMAIKKRCIRLPVFLMFRAEVPEIHIQINVSTFCASLKNSV